MYKITGQNWDPPWIHQTIMSCHVSWCGALCDCDFGGCSEYVILAWIWSFIWYIPLDPIKWTMAYILNENGYRSTGAWKKWQVKYASRSAWRWLVSMQGAACSRWPLPTVQCMR